jgi:hypothetical protein
MLRVKRRLLGLRPFEYLAASPMLMGKEERRGARSIFQPTIGFNGVRI